MNYKRTKTGKFSRYDYKIIAIRRKRTLRTIKILATATVLTLATIQGFDYYLEAKAKFQSIISPVEAQASQELTPKPLTNQDYLIQELEANFSKAVAYDIYTMLRACENKALNPDADNTFGNSKGVDRGIFMINDKYHAEVSNDCAYNLECNIKEGIRIFNERGFKEWSCGKSLGLNK